MATSLYGQRKTMTKEELDKDKASQEERIRKNNEVLKRAEALDTGPGSLGAAMKKFGAMANEGLKKDIEEINKLRKANSREQYEHERKAGDPNALKLSYEEWKKL